MPREEVTKTWNGKSDRSVSVPLTKLPTPVLMPMPMPMSRSLFIETDGYAIQPARLGQWSNSVCLSPLRPLTRLFVWLYRQVKNVASNATDSDIVFGKCLALLQR